MTSKKPFDIVDKVVVKKTVYDRLITKVNDNEKVRNSCGLVKNTDYNTKILKIGNKIPNAIVLVKKTCYDAKLKETKHNIAGTTDLVKKS